LDEIKLHGYNVTSHSIVSDDGYISTILRIFGNSKSPPKPGKPAVLLLHGGMGGSASWIIQPGDRNFAFKLANNGYEVWLASLRGTKPSQNHTHLDANADLEYWDFNMEHIGTKDLALFVDLILETTKNEEIYFACHCGGCAIYLIGLSETPELNRKFKAGFLMAPGVFTGSSSSLSLNLATMFIETPMSTIVNWLLNGRFSSELAFGLTWEKICSISLFQCGFCDRVFFTLYGNDAPQLNFTDFPKILGKLQDDFGFGLFVHGMQNFKRCSFRKFDYGMERTLIEYGTPEPPPFNLSKVAVPTYIFYGESDNMVTPMVSSSYNYAFIFNVVIVLGFVCYLGSG